MSRHSIPARLPGHSVDVGWDNPMSTFFAQVEVDNPADEDDAVVLWLGGQDREYPRPEDMIEPLAPYADLTPDMIEILRSDRRHCNGSVSAERDAAALTTERKSGNDRRTEPAEMVHRSAETGPLCHVGAIRSGASRVACWASSYASDL
jgi:hypothetical protein